MNDLPAPLTPHECDLRGMEWMPFHGHRLFSSDLMGMASDSEIVAAQRLWWAAWQQQVPAASLPDDDRLIAHLAGYARDPRGWAKVRNMALHGFVKCNDGRLYHKFLAGEAVVAWEKRKKERERKAAQRAAKAAQDALKNSELIAAVPRDNGETKQERPAPVPMPVPGLSHGTGRGQVADVPADRTGQDRTESKKERTGLRPDADASPSVVVPLPARDRLWSDGLRMVMDLTGKPSGPARALLGKWAKAAGDDCAGLLAILADAVETRPIDPVPWVVEALRARSGGRRGAGELRERWNLPSLLDGAMAEEIEAIEPRRLTR